MSDEIPYSGTHYEVVKVDGVWRIRLERTNYVIEDEIFFDLDRANRKAKSLDAKANQTDAFTAPERPSKE